MNITKFDYSGAMKGIILHLSILGSENRHYVSRVSVPILQPSQVGFTPSKKVELTLIKDLEIFKNDPECYENLEQIEVYPSDVYDIEKVDLIDLGIKIDFYRY
ncbi:hypothetical protein [Peijinzhouia sedimentorum]